MRSQIVPSPATRLMEVSTWLEKLLDGAIAGKPDIPCYSVEGYERRGVPLEQLFHMHGGQGVFKRSKGKGGAFGLCEFKMPGQTVKCVALHTKPLQNGNYAPAYLLLVTPVSEVNIKQLGEKAGVELNAVGIPQNNYSYAIRKPNTNGLWTINLGEH